MSSTFTVSRRENLRETSFFKITLNFSEILPIYIIIIGMKGRAQMKNSIRNVKAFTLVEVIVVMVIIAILAALMVPSLTKYIDRSNDMKYVSDGRHALVAAQTVISEKYGKKRQMFNEDDYPQMMELAELDDRAAVMSVTLKEGTMTIEDMVIADEAVYVHYNANGGMKYDKFELEYGTGISGGNGSQGGSGNPMTADGISAYLGSNNTGGLSDYLSGQGIKNQAFLSNKKDDGLVAALRNGGVSENLKNVKTAVVSLNRNDGKVSAGGTVELTEYLYYKDGNGSWVLFGTRDTTASVVKTNGNGHAISYDGADTSAGWVKQ